MEYAKIVLNEMPKPIFAHVYESTNYDYFLPKVPGVLEITFVEKGDISIYRAGEHVCRCLENSLFVQYNKEDTRCKSDAPFHRHVTVGLALDYGILPVSAENILACWGKTDLSTDGCLIAILPLDSTVVLSPQSKIRDLLHEIACLYANMFAGNKLLLQAKIMELVFEVTQECVRQVFLSKKISPANIRYVHSAMEYISEHVREKVPVEEVAKSVGLSVGYLSAMFKTVTGQTLTEYTNRMKLQLVKDMVLSGKMSFAEAGNYVGIADSSYLSRLFRKYLRMTIRELKNDQKLISEETKSVS